MNPHAWRWPLRFAFVAVQGLLVLCVLSGYRFTAAAIALADACICSGVAIYLSRAARPAKSHSKRSSRRRD